MTMPTPDRDRLRRLADAATEGPWEVYGTSISAYTGPGDCGGCSGLLSPAHEPYCEQSEIAGAGESDAEFIAAARTAVPQLLDALDAAEARLQAIRDLHHPWGDTLTHTTICDSCDDAYPCPTVRALESVPPPSA